MSRGKDFARNTVILFAGTFFTRVIHFFLFPIYTGYLSTAEYGTVELYNTIISLVIPIISFQIDYAIFRYLIDNRSNHEIKSELISTSLFFVIASMTVTLILATLVLQYIADDNKWLVIANLIVNYLSAYLGQVSRGLGRNSDYSISRILTSLFSILFNIIFLVGVGLKINGMLYGSVIGFLIGNLYLFVRLDIYHYLSLKRINVKSLKQMLGYSLPMVPNSLSWWAFSSSDRIIISYFVGVGATGLLSVAYKFSNIIWLVFTVFIMSLTESVSLHINDEDISDYYSGLYNKICNAFTTCGALLIAGMPIVFRILINRSFDGSYNLIPIAIIASIFQVFATGLNVVYISKGDTKSLAVTSIASAIVNVVVDVVLVHYIGVYAAVVSTIVSYLVLFLYRLFDINNKFFIVKIGKGLIISTVIMLLINCPIYYFQGILPVIVNILISLILVFVINKDSLKYVIVYTKRLIGRLLSN